MCVMRMYENNIHISHTHRHTDRHTYTQHGQYTHTLAHTHTYPYTTDLRMYENIMHAYHATLTLVRGYLLGRSSEDVASPGMAWDKT